MIERFQRIGKALLASGGSHALSSATNLILNIVLLRFLSPAEFGIYGIGFAGVLLFSSAGTALFLSQMIANSPDRDAADKASYASTILASVVIFVGATTLIVLLGTVGIWFAVESWRPFIPAFLSFTLFAAAINVRNFFITHFFICKREMMAVWINTTVTLSLILMMIPFVYRQADLTVTYVALVNGASLALGSLIGLAAARLPMASVSRHRIAEDFRECWENGRWALGGIAVGWAQSQAYLTVSGLILGPASIGLANAARLFVAPFLLLPVAVNQIALPRLSEWRNTNREKVARFGQLIALGLIVVFLVYILILFWKLDYLSELLLKNEFATARTLVWAWCVVVLFQLMRSGGVAVLLAFKQFKAVTLIFFYTAIGTVIVAAVLCLNLGVSGAILGMAAGEAMAAGLLWRMAYRAI